MKCLECAGFGQVRNRDCFACGGRGTVGRGTVANGERWVGDPESDPDRPRDTGGISEWAARVSQPPDLPPDYPGLTDEDGAMVAFMVRCKQWSASPGPYLPAYLAGWFLAACKAPLPTDPAGFGQFRDSIRNGHADCEERQAQRVKYAARPVEYDRQTIASDLLQAARAYDDVGDERLASIFRERAARIMAGKHREGLE